jgi:hypothetical protein
MRILIRTGPTASLNAHKQEQNRYRYTRYQGCRSEHEQGSEPRLNLPESPADEAHWRAVQSAEPATAPICRQNIYNVLFCNVKKKLKRE